jgi:pyruvate/2-oxoglutarate dehydrogenase complex dihydrolipoamide acyltransferase (E2) component
LNRIAFGAGIGLALAASAYFTAVGYTDVKPIGLRDGGSAEAGSPSTPPAAASTQVATEPVLLFDAGSVDAAVFALPSLSLDDAGFEPRSFASASVRFGVVLVSYAGAQGSSSSRSKDAAEELARKLAEEAKTNFNAAVGKGDSGSMEDAGRIQRGVLESEAESALFSLAVGNVSGPVRTPRGFWIVKRLE